MYHLSPPFLMMSYLGAFFGQETSYIILILQYASWFKVSPYHNMTNNTYILKEQDNPDFI